MDLVLFIQLVNLCLSIWVFNPFIFKVSTDMEGFPIAILLQFVCLTVILFFFPTKRQHIGQVHSSLFLPREKSVVRSFLQILPHSAEKREQIGQVI